MAKANKIPLTSGKTELVLFRSKGKNFTKNMNFKINGQKINMISQTRYLELILDEHVTFKYYLRNLKLKLNRSNCLLSKIRYMSNSSYCEQYIMHSLTHTYDLVVKFGVKDKINILNQLKKHKTKQ